MGVDDPDQPVEVVVQEARHERRVVRVGEMGEGLEVGEQHRDLALLRGEAELHGLADHVGDDPGRAVRRERGAARTSARLPEAPAGGCGEARGHEQGDGERREPQQRARRGEREQGEEPVARHAAGQHGRFRAGGPRRADECDGEAGGEQRERGLSREAQAGAGRSVEALRD